MFISRYFCWFCTEEWGLHLSVEFHPEVESPLPLISSKNIFIILVGRCDTNNALFLNVFRRIFRKTYSGLNGSRTKILDMAFLMPTLALSYVRVVWTRARTLWIWFRAPPFQAFFDWSTVPVVKRKLQQHFTGTYFHLNDDTNGWQAKLCTTPFGQEKKTLTFKVLLYLFRQDHGFHAPCGSHQVLVFLKL